MTPPEESPRPDALDEEIEIEALDANGLTIQAGATPRNVFDAMSDEQHEAYLRDYLPARLGLEVREEWRIVNHPQLLNTWRKGELQQGMLEELAELDGGRVEHHTGYFTPAEPVPAERKEVTE